LEAESLHLESLVDVEDLIDHLLAGGFPHSQAADAIALERAAAGRDGHLSAAHEKELPSLFARQRLGTQGPERIVFEQLDRFGEMRDVSIVHSAAPDPWFAAGRAASPRPREPWR